jgi:hypothetical protein
LVASGRSDNAEVGQAPVRRYRLARMRLSTPTTAGAPRLDHPKRN